VEGGDAQAGKLLTPPDCRAPDQENASPLLNLSFVTCSCTSILNMQSVTACLHGHKMNNSLIMTLVS